jgi:hypothetical protein
VLGMEWWLRMEATMDVHMGHELWKMAIIT